MLVTEKSLHKMIDFTLLHNTDTEEDIRAFAQKTIEGNYAAAYVMPNYSGLMAELLKDTDIAAGGAVAFPTGAEPLEIKLAMVRHHISVGAKEIDYVIDIPALKSGRVDNLRREALAIVEAAQGRVVKAILEVTILTDEELAIAAKAVADAGVDFIKTGTGTQPNPTKVEHIEKIRSAVGPDVGIKAAGGIRDVETVVRMLRLGVRRFGISHGAALKILGDFAEQYPAGLEI